MGRIVLALAVTSLLAAGCFGSRTEPSGKLSIVVTLGAGSHPAIRHYTLRCGPAGGTMPDAGAACGALADFVRHRSDRTRFCSGFSATVPSARVDGAFDGRRLRLTLTAISWCGVSDDLMRDFWVLSTFPCSTVVFRYADQHPYSKGIAPERCLR